MATNSNLRVALLRAVNVGGTGKLAMADLRAMTETLGFSEPTTLLQSGNLIFADADKPDAELEALFEAALEERLGVRSDFIIRTPDEWAAIVAANPFATEAEDDPRFVHVMALKAAPPASALTALREAIAGSEKVALDGRALYIHYPDGAGRSKLTNVLIEKKLGTRGTARNWNTVLKIAALLGL
jgi:uncharacterized protein (DUF1697 family)